MSMQSCRSTPQLTSGARRPNPRKLRLVSPKTMPGMARVSGTMMRDGTEFSKVYPLYIAKLKRIYYLDLPLAYQRLNDDFPPLSVRPFGEFFFEWSALAPD